tara:strand:- start:8506 stop:11280 length:2775 start_codon:yes stop_codon:yes gene_type:complete
MKNTFLLLAFISIFLSNNKVIAQCAVAEKYVADIQNFQDNATPTEYASSGKKIEAWTQFAAWNAYKCQCDSPENLSDSEIPQLVNAMNATRGIISTEYSSYGIVPKIYKVSDCPKGSSNSSNSASSKTSTQIEMEQRFRNYNNAMNLKRQGENIAKAYAQQVKSYGELNSANSPEALLQNFNNNMQAIADLEAQNKEDNLNQLSNTLNSSLNDLNTGNYEGAMFSALSLLDQAEAKREAQKEADAAKGRLAYQTKQKMTAFYTKAVELNDDAIKQYNEKAAYAYSKEEETYLLEHIENLECHKNYMETNFNYSSTAWTQNRCAIPEKRTYTVNNLIAKDIQYINAAKRKYALYEKTGEPIFQQGAMRFAGLAATENPKTEYYYLMGHFAGTNNPLVAYSSFLTVESKNAKYFEGEKATEYSIIKMSLELYLKKAVEENNQEIIKNIVGAGLHQSVSVDGYLPIVYAMKIDQADVVYAFLNTELEGKPQSIINTKVQEIIMMSALLDAPSTIQKFADIGFSVDFIIDGKTPLDAAEESLSLNSFKKIEELLGGQSKYNEDNSDLVKLKYLITAADNNDTLQVMNIHNSLTRTKAKTKAMDALLFAKQRDGLFFIYENNRVLYNEWKITNRDKIFTQFAKDILYVKNRNVYKYLSNSLITLHLSKDGYLNNKDLHLFIKTWVEESVGFFSLSEKDRGANKLNHNFITYWEVEKRKQNLDDLIKKPSLYPDLINIQYSGHPERYWNSKDVYEYIIKGSGYNRSYKKDVNILELSMHYRYDTNLTRVLLKNYFSQTPNKINDNQVKYFLSNPKPLLQPYQNAYNYKESSKAAYDITQIFLFEFGYYNKETTFNEILGESFFRKRRAISETESTYLKKLIENIIERNLLPETPYSNSDENIRYSKENIKQSTDHKYWKAIYDGNYDKRY